MSPLTLLWSQSRNRLYDATCRRNSFVIEYVEDRPYQRCLLDNYLNWINVPNIHHLGKKYVITTIEVSYRLSDDLKRLTSSNSANNRVESIVYLFYDNQKSDVSDLRSWSHSGYFVFVFFTSTSQINRILNIYIYIQRFLQYDWWTIMI